MRTACDKAMPRLPRPTHEIPYELEIDHQTWNDGNAKNPEILWYRCDWPRCPNWVNKRHRLASLDHQDGRERQTHPSIARKSLPPIPAVGARFQTFIGPADRTPRGSIPRFEAT
jgi:hypothetical protein